MKKLIGILKSVFYYLGYAYFLIAGFLIPFLLGVFFLTNMDILNLAFNTTDVILLFYILFIAMIIISPLRVIAEIIERKKINVDTEGINLIYLFSISIINIMSIIIAILSPANIYSISAFTICSLHAFTTFLYYDEIQ